MDTWKISFKEIYPKIYDQSFYKHYTDLLHKLSRVKWWVDKTTAFGAYSGHFKHGKSIIFV